jgi:hypothetical protein
MFKLKALGLKLYALSFSPFFRSFAARFQNVNPSFGGQQ